MKSLVMYLAALVGGAAVGAGGVASYNVFLGEGAVVEAAGDPEESLELEPQAAPDDPGTPAADEPQEEPSLVNTADAEELVTAATTGDEVASPEDAAVTRAPEPESEIEPALQDADSLARATLNFQRLARIFAAMEPEEAAPVLAQLDDAQLEGILMAMQGRNAAPILAQMDPARVAALSRRVLRGNQ